MKVAPKSIDEKKRLDYLNRCHVLDTESEKKYDDLVKLAAQICECPIAAISLLDADRQWFKAKIGIDLNETARDISFCSHAILQSEILEVTNALEDERFFDNPLVINNPNIRFYAGAPLISDANESIGVLSVIDTVPKKLNENQKNSLKILAQQVMLLLSLRVKSKQEKDLQDFVNNKLNQFEKLVAQAPGVLYQYQQFSDGRSCFPYASQKIEEIYEVKPEQVHDDASDVFKMIHPDDFVRVADSIQHSAEKLSPWECEYRVKLPLQGVRWRYGHSIPEKQSDGSIIWHGFITDITDKKNNELKVLQTQKMSTLGEMASGIAHEINNPLTIIITKAAQLKIKINKESISNEEVIETISKIESVANRISKIVKGLRTFSRSSEKEEFSLISIKSLVDDVLNLCEEKIKYNQIKLNVVIDKDFEFQCRPVQLSQVLLNLIGNSIQALKDKKNQWIQIHISERENKITILVVDSGLGIDEVTAQKIMQPFFTTKEPGEGTGLGLSISKGIVEDHGGELEYIQECPNTTFKLVLPTYQNEQSENFDKKVG